MWLELARPGTLVKLLQHFEYEDTEDGRRSSGTKRQKSSWAPRTRAVLTPDHTRSSHRLCAWRRSSKCGTSAAHASGSSACPFRSSPKTRQPSAGRTLPCTFFPRQPWCANRFRQFQFFQGAQPAAPRWRSLPLAFDHFVFRRLARRKQTTGSPLLRGPSSRRRRVHAEEQPLLGQIHQQGNKVISAALDFQMVALGYRVNA